MNLQHLVGTQGFLPAALTHIREAASPASLPIDQVIFQSILLCLITQNKHLIIRTPEEDLGLTIQVVVWTLSSIFDLKTHKLKIRKSQKKSIRSARSSTPGSHRRPNNNNDVTNDSRQLVDDFLRSLFFHPTTSTSPSNQTLQDEESPEGHARAHSTHTQVSASRKQSSRHIRQASFPTNLTAVSHGQSRNFPDTASTSASSTDMFESPVDSPTGSSPLILPSILKPQPLYAFPHPSQTQSPSPRLSHAKTDPLPASSSQRKKSRSQSLRLEDTKTPKVFPEALVITGLENATIAVQRAFSTVLGNKKVLLDDKKGEGGEWTLPEGFLCVYICSWNARERPTIHKTLLDNFAMSANVFISQSIRSDFRLLPFILSSVTASPKLHHSNFSYSNPGSPSAPAPLPLPPTHTPPIYMKPLPGHGHQVYHSHMQQSQRSSTQHGFPLTPPFGSHALPHTLHSPPLLQQPRPATPFRLPPLLPPGFLEALRVAYRQTHVAYSLDLYLSDLMSATRHDSRLDGTLLTAQSMKDARDLVKASRVIGADLTGMELVRPVPFNSSQENEGRFTQNEGDEEEFHSTHSNPEALEESKVGPILEISEVDVARIFPRVVSHRLRLRDGPHDEVLSSVLYGATVEPPLSAIPEGETASESVKAVLVDILSEV